MSIYINVQNRVYLILGDQNHQVLHHLEVKEQSIPRGRNIVEADLAVIVMDDLENRKKLSEDDPAVINHHVVVIDRVVDLEIEM